MTQESLYKLINFIAFKMYSVITFVLYITIKDANNLLLYI
jgi:hypothetical protein